MSSKLSCLYPILPPLPTNHRRTLLHRNFTNLSPIPSKKRLRLPHFDPPMLLPIPTPKIPHSNTYIIIDRCMLLLLPPTQPTSPLTLTPCIFFTCPLLQLLARIHSCEETSRRIEVSG